MAVAASAVWRVRPSGVNTNGGGFDASISSATGPLGVGVTGSHGSLVHHRRRHDLHRRDGRSIHRRDGDSAGHVDKNLRGRSVHDPDLRQRNSDHDHDAKPGELKFR